MRHFIKNLLLIIQIVTFGTCAIIGLVGTIYDFIQLKLETIFTRLNIPWNFEMARNIGMICLVVCIITTILKVKLLSK